MAQLSQVQEKAFGGAEAMKISLFFLAHFSGYSKSWDVCSQLAQSEGYQDLATRQELMAFALTHCPPSSIELLLA